MTPTDLRIICAKLNCTHAELAMRLGVTQVTVSNWASGRRRIPRMAEKLLDMIMAEWEAEQHNILVRGTDNATSQKEPAE